VTARDTPPEERRPPFSGSIDIGEVLPRHFRHALYAEMERWHRSQQRVEPQWAEPEQGLRE
jgi:hypothetical protein